MIYLAVPYSHPDPHVRQSRFDAVNIAAARLMNAGAMVFSPISQTHPIALVGDLPKDWKYWEAYDRRILGICTSLTVLMLPGWEESTGVSAEIKIARQNNLPINYIYP